MKKPYAKVYKDGAIPSKPWMFKTHRGIWPVNYRTKRRATEVAEQFLKAEKSS